MAEVQTHTEAGEMTQIFIEFVMMQAQNAALFMGQIPNPRGGPTEVNLPLAKMFIDQLAVIAAKTQGNLTADESRVIESALAQLEEAFIEVANTIGHDAMEAPAGASRPAAIAPAAPEPAPAPASTILPPDAPPEPAPVEEGRKRFTKSYGA